MTEVCENAILTHLASSEDATIADTFPWAEEKQLPHGSVVGAVKSLLADEYVVSDDLATSFYTISSEAEGILKDGSQEYLVLKALVEKGKLSMPDLQQAVGKAVAKIGMGNCMKNKWIKKDGADLVPLKTLEEVQDTVQVSLQTLADGKFAEDAIDNEVGVNDSWEVPSCTTRLIYNVRVFNSLPTD